jgi:ubiquinone/menaquinone biosynthesis C-methylase UbiE
VTKPSREHFDALADRYASSSVHRLGASLPVLLRLAAATATDEVLDVATGPGTTAFAVAPYVHRVTGLDVSGQTLAQAQIRAEQEGVVNVAFVEGAAPHHFRDLPAFLNEVQRVLKPEGRFVLADQISPAAELTDWLDFWQRTRDPSHFRQRTVNEWKELATEAGFLLRGEQIVPYRLEFGWWTTQAACTPETVEQLRRHATGASPAVRQAMNLEFGEDAQIVAHHDPVFVARFEKR